MSKEKSKNNLPENTDTSFEQEPIAFDTDIDFWDEVLTEYGEIESRQELSLILKKIKTETQREQVKAKKKKVIVAKRNKMAIKKEHEQKHAKQRAFSALSPAQKAAYKRKQADEAALEKGQAAEAKIQAKQKKIDDKVKLQEQRAIEQQYNVQERLFLMSLTPQEKAVYRFLKGAKKQIDAAQKKKDAAIAAQQEVAKSDILPVGGFLKALLICVLVTAVLAFCGTNIYLDTQYYNEKIDVLRTGITDFDTKLDGDMVVGVGDLESGLSVYQQILNKAPIITEQLDMLNNTYFWVLNKETIESLGLAAVEEEATELKTIIDQLQMVVDNNTAFTQELDEAYQADLPLLELRAMMDQYGVKIAAIESDFDAIPLPKGLPEHKDAYLEKIRANETYYQTMLAYLDELVAVREMLTDGNEIVASAKGMRPHSGSLEYKVGQYLDEMEDIEDAEKKISGANNNIDYALIIGKKDLNYVGQSIMSEDSLTFYSDMQELYDIVKESIKVEKKSLDLPYPDEEKTTDQAILSHISLGTTDDALEMNKELETRVAAISAPERISSDVRAFTTGLELRTEFLALQKQYIDYESEKAALYVEYDKAKALYDTAEVNANLERRANGRTELYYQYRDEMEEAEKAMDEAYDAAYDAADEIQELMKDIRRDAISKKEEYEDYLDY